MNEEIKRVFSAFAEIPFSSSPESDEPLALVSFSGHCGAISVETFNNGWKYEKEPTFNDHVYFGDVWEGRTFNDHIEAMIEALHICRDAHREWEIKNEKPCADCIVNLDEAQDKFLSTLKEVSECDYSKISL